MKYDVIAAHAYCTNNKPRLEYDTLCGCFYCCRIFSPNRITEWLSDTDGTAICPYCGIDSVMGQYAGYPITPDFLGKMKRYWFGDSD